MKFRLPNSAEKVKKFFVLWWHSVQVWIYLSTHSCLVWLPGEVLISPPVASFL